MKNAKSIKKVSGLRAYTLELMDKLVEGKITVETAGTLIKGINAIQKNVALYQEQAKLTGTRPPELNLEEEDETLPRAVA